MVIPPTTQNAPAGALRSSRGFGEVSTALDGLEFQVTGTRDLGSIWNDLCAGKLKVTRTLETAEHHVLQLEQCEAPDPLDARRRRTLENGLRIAQNRVAIELDVAPSTVALNMRLALEQLGVSGKPSRAPAMLVLASEVANSGSPLVVEAQEGRNSLSVRLPRIDAQLENVPAAERAVISGLVNGASYEQIARERGTSTRTVANQIAAVFRRCRVSGRNEFLVRLFADQHRAWSASAPQHGQHGAAELAEARAAVDRLEAMLGSGPASTDHPRSVESRLAYLEKEIATFRKRLDDLELAFRAKVTFLKKGRQHER